MTQKTIPVSKTCANGTGIEKGTVLKIADLNTVSAAVAANDNIGGIAYTEKIANDGNTQIAVLTGPGDELKGTASGAITVGDPLVTAVPANYLASGRYLANVSGAVVIGIAAETAAAGETFKYVLNIQTGHGAIA